MSNFSYKSMMEKLDNALEQDTMINGYLDMIQQKTNIKKRYVVLAVVTFLSIYLVYGYGADLLCNLIGFVYPAYISVKAVESANKDDDTEWLIYWVVFAVFSIVEFFSDIVLSWFPFYYLGKCAFLLWCMAPVSWNGSSYIYRHFVRPFVLRNEKKIDNVLEQVQEDAKELIGAASDQVSVSKMAQATEAVHGVVENISAEQEPLKDEEPKKDV